MNVYAIRICRRSNGIGVHLGHGREMSSIARLPVSSIQISDVNIPPIPPARIDNDVD